MKLAALAAAALLIGGPAMAGDFSVRAFARENNRLLDISDAHPEMSAEWCNAEIALSDLHSRHDIDFMGYALASGREDRYENYQKNFRAAWANAEKCRKAEQERKEAEAAARYERERPAREAAAAERKRQYLQQRSIRVFQSDNFICDGLSNVVTMDEALAAGFRVVAQEYRNAASLLGGNCWGYSYLMTR